MNMMFDFYIPKKYRNRKVEIPNLGSEEKKFVLKIPKTAHYLFIQPCDSEEEVGGQLQLYLPLFGIKYFTSRGDIIKRVGVQKYYGEIHDELPFLESRLEQIFEGV